MSFVELFLVAVGLSMDAFAVSICKGLDMRKFSGRQAGLVALFFGGFQALMPLVGWVVGAQFAQLVSSVAHWIAFGLLAFIGGKMIYDSFAGEQDGEDSSGGGLDLRELTMLAVATSIDALAVGVSFAFLQVEIVHSVVVIGLTTAILSYAGVFIGFKFGSRWEGLATRAGGIILILIGVKIVVERFVGL